MDRATKETARKLIYSNFINFDEVHLQDVNTIKKYCEEYGGVARNLVEQICNTKADRLMPKTPRVPRKRIQTIPEDDVVNGTIVENGNDSSKDGSGDEVPTRSKRGASIKATENIKKQQSLTLNEKLRRPSSLSIVNIKRSRVGRPKRPKDSFSESDEDIGRKPAKLNKMDDMSKCLPVKVKEEPMYCTEHEDDFDLTTEPEKEVKVIQEQEKAVAKQANSLRRSSRNSSKSLNTPENRNIIEETLIEQDTSTAEPSMYEDAVGKPLMMNSTMNPNSTVTIDKKIMNVTVVLSKMDETVTLNKSKESLPKEHKKRSNEPVPSVLQSKAYLQNKLSTFKTNLKTPEFDELLTDDESELSESSDEKNKNKGKQQLVMKKALRPKISSTSDTDDEVMSSPEKSRANQLKYRKDMKHKQSALFSPYAKESVKKRVAAFEKAVNDKPDENSETGGRVTRTKTRAMANNHLDVPKTPSAAILARKSLSKAKKICRAKEQRENEDEKENTLLNTAQKQKPVKNDKTAQKQQLRTTPVSKSRLQMPTPVSRVPHTPISSQLQSASKATSVSRGNNHATSTDATASASKPLSKSNSTDSLADKRQKSTIEEDARTKKEEALKAQTDERRRKREEKEQRIKLAREAREKMEQEKRLKLEKEKVEKARLAVIMQEKIREEAEKKKFALSQRALEKEEKRKREEHMKLLRIQEQEETERRLAEQKRREQEAERRRLVDARAQQLAAAEAARIKQQYQAKVKQQLQIKQQHELHGPASYKIDSDPDDDESDNESRPKHPIPYWAQQHIRKNQLEMQQYIPMNPVLKFFGAKKCTPNLSEFFIGIKKDRLKRTSSAVWKTPPRFSMMGD